MRQCITRINSNLILLTLVALFLTTCDLELCRDCDDKGMSPIDVISFNHYPAEPVIGDTVTVELVYSDSTNSKLDFYWSSFGFDGKTYKDNSIEFLNGSTENEFNPSKSGIIYYKNNLNRNKFEFTGYVVIQVIVYRSNRSGGRESEELKIVGG